jgi:hypothetical protein
MMPRDQGRRWRFFFFGEEAMRVLPWFGAAVLVIASGALAHDRFGNPNSINIGR